MSLPYVQINYQEALNARKDILSSQINIISLAKKISSWKKLRKAELGKKITLKKAIKHSTAQVNLLMRELPDVDGEKFRAENTGENYSKTETLGEKSRKKSIEQELEDIKQKLARLNRG